jgi:hypothetical protein
MHRNSLECWDTSDFNPRELQVLKAFSSLGRPVTDKQVMEHLGFSDPNSVRPRITHLIEVGIVAETGSTRDPDTNKTVRLSYLTV